MTTGPAVEQQALFSDLHPLLSHISADELLTTRCPVMQYGLLQRAHQAQALMTMKLTALRHCGVT